MFPDIRGSDRATRPSGLLARIFAGLVTLGAVAVGLMFSVVVFAVALVLAIGFFGWLWWRMRRALRQVQADPPFQPFGPAASGPTAPRRGQIIEGEVIHKD